MLHYYIIVQIIFLSLSLYESNFSNLTKTTSIEIVAKLLSINPNPHDY